MDVGGSSGTQYAPAGAAIAAGSVWIGNNEQYPNSLDMWWQGNGSRLMECIDENATYNITALPVG